MLRPQIKWAISQVKMAGGGGWFSHMHRSHDKEKESLCDALSARAGILHLPAYYSCGQGLKQCIYYLHLYFVTGEDAQSQIFLIFPGDTVPDHGRPSISGPIQSITMYSRAQCTVQKRYCVVEMYPV
jgi:hypothetical protein